MTRSSLLLLQRCYPKAFACHLGSMAGELVPGSGLAEPVWAGLITWYLPFVVLFFLLYFPQVVILHGYMSTFAEYCNPSSGGESYMSCKLYNAFRTAIHAVVDGTLPIGLLHAYMTSLEERMNELVVRLSTQFSAEPKGQQDTTTPT